MKSSLGRKRACPTRLLGAPVRDFLVNKSTLENAVGTIAPLCREHETTACTKAGLRKVAATPRPSLTVLECGVCTRVAWPVLVFCLHVTSVTGVNTVICLQNLTRFRSARPDFTLALPSQAVGKQCYVLLRIRKCWDFLQCYYFSSPNIFVHYKLMT